MAGDETELTIRSQHGLLRDLIPIYGFRQLVPNLVALGLVLWLSLAIGHFPTGLLPFLMLGWVFQYVSRPSAMTVTPEQAAWLEEVLDEQGYYERSEADGRWRLSERQWWHWSSHLFVGFVPGERVTVIAPRDSMESIRASLELLDEHEILFPDGDQPFVFTAGEPEPLPWHVQVPGWGLGIACVLAAIWYIATHEMGGMLDWGVSGAALAQGRFETLFLHMFAHSGAMHLAMNMTMLAAIGGALTARLGSPPLSWLRFLALYLLCGLAGAALYLAIHPTGTVPMVGASGALYGMFALLIRAPEAGEGALPVNSRRIRRVGWDLIKQNVFLFALLATMAWLQGAPGGLAWEAHLGGFLFGLFVGPRLLPRPAAVAESRAPAVVAAD
ncbi:rhomboid family intramembrane serine protease [Sphingomonas sp. HITSZ_GF]|uniref:rhomboid family intramembrane serine protease n=1 Tax=Sphingomonas sp. HITSZ_GF TaxID=3037247 RepID=UPI00240D4847|nr:rhomboid family intramembrane serine protease [Sphingomonas sp. HITSZ_GF]MDG2532975.1 rhomboid family intramembrane serine protease [Sphingomonas sp. HITSZ_GF]